VRILCYNVNGIRAAMNRGLLDFLAEANADVVCFQEIKANPEQFDTELFAQMGYTCAWHPAQKKGYSGVAILSRRKPDQVIEGMGVAAHDAEGRVLRADFGELTVVSVYWPSGSSGDHRQEVKMQFLEDFMAYQLALRAARPNVVICGDYNICHRAIDIHDPVGNKNSSGFLPEERDWMDRYFATGMVDSFRHFYPELPHQYTWWSFRANARNNNKGWRIDYHAVSQPLVAQLSAAAILPDAHHSDHCPITVDLALRGW
jgi:exodeoxyribonuclease-3